MTTDKDKRDLENIHMSAQVLLESIQEFEKLTINHSSLVFWDLTHTSFIASIIQIQPELAKLMAYCQEKIKEHTNDH